MNVIEVNNITKHYLLGSQTVEALRGVTFGIRQGEFIAIMGPSGSGKSTLMNIIGCLDSPTNGTYHLNNKEVSTLEGDELAGIRNREIGFVFQNFHLLARNSALDNVMLPLKYAGFNRDDQLKKARETLSKVGLESRMNHQPSELSGGQQQRVAIARALVNNPSILFADEPTGNLDSQTGHDVMQLFHNLHQQGQTIILITHENEIAAEAQRVIYIKDGLIESDVKKGLSMTNKVFKGMSLFLLLILVVSCGGGKEEEEFKFYALKEAASQQLELTVEASGTVEAISSIEIKSKASGQILFLGAEIGDYVEEGVVLARIDQRTPTNTLAQANADLEVAKVRLSNAKINFSAQKRLHEEGNISDKSFEDAQESFSSARAQLVRAEVFLENARIALDDTSVRSPIAGTVISRPAEVGQVITSPTSAVGGGTLLMEMADLNNVRVRALIDEIDIGKISIGQEVTLKVSAYRDKKFLGVVSKIEPMSKVDQNVTTFPVLIDIENKDNLLLIGMNTDVEIEILNEKVAIALPAGSLRTRKDILSVAPLLNIKEDQLRNFLAKKVEGENFDVFIVLKNKKGAVPTWIKTGKTDLNYVEVKEGIKFDETVYVLPSEGLIKYQQKFSERIKGRFG